MSYPDRSRSGREEDRVIDLADEPDFDLGGMHVAPSTRELFGPGGREVLEPRVMMVLVVLAGHRGHTVSRDHLVELCWGGLVVGDDAINRVIGKLRKLAAASGAFEIETITKVGYLLKELPADGAAVAAANGRIEAHGPPKAERSLRGPTLVALAVGVAALAGYAWLWKPARVPEPVGAVASGATAADPVVEALVKQGLAAVQEHAAVQVQQGVAQLQEATARDPKSARAWGALALGYSALWHRTPPEQQLSLIHI
jgi:DNA-binding winged helix-turn-helix (wHTH) protein